MPRERILIVIDGMEIGGSQRQVQQLLQSLDRQRWEPELAYFRNHSFLADAIRDSGIVVHYLPKRRRIDPAFLLAFARLLRERNYALIHAFSLTAELASVQARFLSGRRPPLVASERSFALDKPAWFWRLKRFVLGHSAAVIANSRAGARATARRTRMPDTLFTTVANGVDLPAPIGEDARRNLRRSLGVADARLLGLFVGRLVPVKNLPCLVRALARLEPGMRPRIVLVGEGPVQEEVQQLAVDLGVAADLCFLGERSDVDRLMQAADFLVLPSHFEGLSNALLEAMAARCPVVASAVGGSVELIDDGQTGLLFPADDPDALAAAILRMNDATLRMQLAREGRRHVEQHHSPDALAAATSAVYERCLRVREPRDARVLAHPVRGPAK